MGAVVAFVVVLLAGCASSLEVHADLAATLHEGAAREKAAYRAARREAMREAGREAAGVDVESAVRSAGAAFRAEHDAWEAAIAQLASATRLYALGVLRAQGDGEARWGHLAAAALRAALDAYRLLRAVGSGTLPELPAIVEDAVGALLDAFGPPPPGTLAAEGGDL